MMRAPPPSLHVCLSKPCHAVVLVLQTIRRILHLRAGELLGLERPLELKLRVLPLDFAALDVVVPGRAVQLPDAKLDQSYQAQVSLVVGRRVNGQAHSDGWVCGGWFGGCGVGGWGRWRSSACGSSTASCSSRTGTSPCSSGLSRAPPPGSDGKSRSGAHREEKASAGLVHLPSSVSPGEATGGVPWSLLREGGGSLAAVCRGRLFFKLVTGCRRRLQKAWEKTPVETLFTLRTEVRRRTTGLPAFHPSDCFLSMTHVTSIHPLPPS